MKSHLLVASLLMLLLSNLFGAVKNGYEKSIPGLRMSLQSLRTILDCHPHLSRAEMRNIKRKIKLIVNDIACYQVTGRLLSQFREIAPELYDEMAALRDASGKVIDIYVKYIPSALAPLNVSGMSSLTQAPDDVNSCFSEYGRGSVSIVITTLSTALRVLSHEFGHVQYVVPNIESYVEFFRERYNTGGSEVVFGHSFGDRSGHNAYLFEKRYCRRYADYMKQERVSFRSGLVEAKPVRKDLLGRLRYE